MLLNNNTPYTLRRAQCAVKHGEWLVQPPEFIVPGEQGVPFGSGFKVTGAPWKPRVVGLCSAHSYQTP